MTFHRFFTPQQLSEALAELEVGDDAERRKKAELLQSFMETTPEVSREIAAAELHAMRRDECRANDRVVEYLDMN